jgi:two-component system NtrC family sensor kinase
VASLFVIRGNDQGKRFELEDQTLRVGRESSTAVQLHDTEVSRQHAEIRRVDRDYAIADLASSNGTFVNGKRVRQHLLSSGDQIQMGRTLLLYTGPAEEPDEDLVRAISITPAEQVDDESHIVHAVTQEEGSRIFDLATELPQNSWLVRARSNLQVMYRTALAVSHTLEIDQLLQRIMELIFEWVEADRGCIMLIDPASKSLEPKVRRTRDGLRADERITISQTILDYVIGRNEGVLTSDARQDDRFSPAASIVKLGVREAICVPMQGRYDVVGVIYIDTSTSPQEMVQKGGAKKFTEDHLKLMIAIGHQAALAVEDTRYYSAMVQAERLAAVGQTVATLSHHIKNILQGIRGGSYLIELGLTEHDETVVGKGWKIVEKNQNKISNLVMDMLTFSKQREPDLATANVNRVVADAVELMHSRAEELEVELKWYPGEPMPDLVFDPEGLHRAVLNVITNAIDAAGEERVTGVDGQRREAPSGEPPEWGQVVVRSEYSAEKSTVWITVEDNGPGIPPEEIDQLFSPFVSTKKGRGTGLGLPVSQKILSEHGGRILIDSLPSVGHSRCPTQPSGGRLGVLPNGRAGGGSRFTLELPAVLPPDAPQTTASSP